jgi:hypothetical protein
MTVSSAMRQFTAIHGAGSVRNFMKLVTVCRIIDIAMAMPPVIFRGRG